MVSIARVLLIVLLAAMACAQTPVKSAVAPRAAVAQDQVRQGAESQTPPLTPEERGDLYMVRKMFREAIASYRNGPQNSPVTWDKIGIAWHNLGELALARKNYEHALKVDKKYAEAINNIGTVLYAQKKYRAAAGRYRKALSLQPDKASFWSNLGTAYYSMGRFPEMMQAYSKAISLDPEIFEHRGVVGTEMQERTVADRARYHFELARLYAKIGKDDLAVQYLRRCFEEGFKDKAKVNASPEFAGLRENPEFIAVMALEPRVL